jgi:hypothetical protein
LCSDIDPQIPLELIRIQVNPDLLPAIPPMLPKNWDIYALTSGQSWKQH